MIQTNTIPFFGSILCIAVYWEGFLKKTQLAWATDIFRAENTCKRLEKEILRKKIEKFLHHRQNIMDYHGGLKTIDRYRALETLKVLYSSLAKKSLECNCKNFFLNKDLFETIMPGASSEYYKNSRKLIDEIFIFCQQKMK